MLVCYRRLLGKLLADLEGPLGIPLPERILHGDIFLENSMFDGDKIVGLIDFEVCSRSITIQQ